MLFAVVLSTLFASCDDEEVIDCSASYPFDVARFYSTENADMITFNAERSVFNYIQGLTAYTNIEYPKRRVSTLLQRDFKAAGHETLRFLTNTTSLLII